MGAQEGLEGVPPAALENEILAHVAAVGNARAFPDAPGARALPPRPPRAGMQVQSLNTLLFSLFPNCHPIFPESVLSLPPPFSLPSSCCTLLRCQQSNDFLAPLRAPKTMSHRLYFGLRFSILQPHSSLATEFRPASVRPSQLPAPPPGGFHRGGIPTTISGADAASPGAFAPAGAHAEAPASRGGGALSPAGTAPRDGAAALDGNG
jgi:hypothetical protein